jgi:hypothetical protein
VPAPVAAGKEPYFFAARASREPSVIRLLIGLDPAGLVAIDRGAVFPAIVHARVLRIDVVDVELGEFEHLGALALVRRSP